MATITIMLLIVVGVGWGIAILEIDKHKSYRELSTDKHFYRE